MEIKKVLIGMMIVFLLSACTNRNNEVTLGQYVLEDAEAIDMAWLVLSEKNQFVFTRSMLTSYWPSGSYIVEDEC